MVTKLEFFTRKNSLRWILIILAYALKKDENYYPQVFLTEGKYIKEKVIRYITQNTEIIPSDSDEEYFFL